MDQEWTWTGSGSGPELDNRIHLCYININASFFYKEKIPIPKMAKSGISTTPGPNNM